VKLLIKKGKHYHSNFFRRIFFLNAKNRLSFNVKFDQACWYEKVNNDSGDLNKVYGFGGANPQKRSARFAWVPDFERSGVLKIYAYVYDEGERITEYLGEITTGTSSRFELFKGGSYKFSMNGKAKEISVKGKTRKWIRFYPYFGGNNKAPQNMTIELNK
jgi:hypothetical protein